MNVTPEFEKWAKGFSGCDGGNLGGKVWFCGIEWGTGAEHNLQEEFRRPVTKPPQIYKNAEENLKYPFNVKVLKLIAAMRGGSVGDYHRVANETPFPFHRDSEFFKLNLFPIAFKNVDTQLWVDKYQTVTGLSTRDEYLRWCRENRFPAIRSWVEKGQPELIIGVGRSYKDDFQEAFGYNAAENEEDIEGRKLVWSSKGRTTLAVIPFLGFQNGLLNSDQLLQAFGERLGAILAGDKTGPTAMMGEAGKTELTARQSVGPVEGAAKLPGADSAAPLTASPSPHLSAADGWNQTYSDPMAGAQTEFIERALSDTPRTAAELAEIANLIAGLQAYVTAARVTEHLRYHHRTQGASRRAARGDRILRMPQVIYSSGRWHLPTPMKPRASRN